MNLQAYIFGVLKQGYQCYPDSKAFNKYYSNTEKREWVFTAAREGNKVYYTYVGYGFYTAHLEGRTGSCFGISLAIDGNFSTQLRDVFELVQTLYNKLLKSEAILKEHNSRVAFVQTSFIESRDYLHLACEKLIAEYEKNIKDHLKLDTQIEVSNQLVSFGPKSENEFLIEAFMRYGSIEITNGSKNVTVEGRIKEINSESKSVLDDINELIKQLDKGIKKRFEKIKERIEEAKINIESKDSELDKDLEAIKTILLQARDDLGNFQALHGQNLSLEKARKTRSDIKSFHDIIASKTSEIESKVKDYSEWDEQKGFSSKSNTNLKTHDSVEFQNQVPRMEESEYYSNSDYSDEGWQLLTKKIDNRRRRHKKESKISIKQFAVMLIVIFVLIILLVVLGNIFSSKKILGFNEKNNDSVKKEVNEARNDSVDVEDDEILDDHVIVKEEGGKYFILNPEKFTKYADNRFGGVKSIEEFWKHLSLFLLSNSERIKIHFANQETLIDAISINSNSHSGIRQFIRNEQKGNEQLRVNIYSEENWYNLVSKKGDFLIELPAKPKN